MTAGLYISAGNIAEFLARERGLYHRLPEETGSAFPENMTLDEMIHSIVKRSLAENRGNQALTARKLGISRSTLWRMMKEKLRVFFWRFACGQYPLFRSTCRASGLPAQ